MKRSFFTQKTFVRPLAAFLVVGVLGSVPLAQTAAAPLFATDVSSGSTAEKQQLAQLQTRANSEINRRVSNLNAVSALLGKLVNVSAAQQQAYKTAVTNEIATLQTLQTKINNDATLAAAQADATQLDTEYKTYMLVVPKMHLVITADEQQVLEAKFSTLGNKMQDRLSDANNRGEDISGAQVKLNDLLAHTQTAQQQSNSVAQAVPPIQLGQYNANRSVLVSYYNTLNTAHGNLATAQTDAQDLLTAVQKL